jgi:PAS domain S-box-containing protein
MQRSIKVGFALTLAVLVGNVAVAVFNTRTLVENDWWVAHTYAALHSLEAALATLTEAESNQRGYLLTDDQSYLDLHHRACSQIQDDLEQLQRLIQDDPAQVQRLDELVPLVGRRLSDLKAGIALRMRQKLEGAAAPVPIGAGKADMDRIRRVMAEMSAEEERLLESRLAQSQTSARRTLYAFGMATALALASFVLVYILVRRDLRERRRALAVLRGERERFRVTLASIGDAVIVTDTSGRVTFLNTVAEALTGCGQDALGRLLNEVFRTVQEMTRTPVESPVARVLRGGEVAALAEHTVLIARDGTERPIDDSAAPIRDAQGRTVGVVLVFRDVTKHRRAEEALRASEERFRALIEHASDAICLLASDGTILYATPGYYRVLGRAPEEVLGRPALAGVHPDDLAVAQGGFEEMLRLPDRPLTQQLRVRHRDGTWRWLEITGNNLLHLPSVQAIVTNFHDVTERHRSGERLREQAALLDQATDAIFVEGMEGQVFYWNRAAERLYGWSAAEALGRDAGALLERDPAARAGVLAALDERGEWQGELTQVTKAGGEVVVASRWTLLHDEAGQPRSRLAINTDITEKKRLEAQLLRSQRLESIGTLAGGIAHDLNNVLTPILMGLEILKVPLEEQQRTTVLDTLLAAAERGAAMVKQVLLFARGAETGRTSLPLCRCCGSWSACCGTPFPRRSKSTSRRGRSCGRPPWTPRSSLRC